MIQRVLLLFFPRLAVYLIDFTLGPDARTSVVGPVILAAVAAMAIARADGRSWQRALAAVRRISTSFQERARR